MPQASVPDEPVLPRWLVVVGSAVILFHLTAIIIPVLDVPSGPWPSPNPMVEPMLRGNPPKFAESASELSTMHADWFRVAHSFYFVSDQPANIPEVEFEVLLKDAQGNLMETLHYPDPNANLWVRHRQKVLASALAGDQSLPPNQSVAIPAPGAQIPTTLVWMEPKEHRADDAPLTESIEGHPVQFWLKEEHNHLLPRGRPLSAPGDLTLILVRSYARYLCRSHGAARAEVVRLMRDPIPPAVLYGQDLPPEMYRDKVATFGDKTSEELKTPLGKKSR
jgi:hypothetical protein